MGWFTVIDVFRELGLEPDKTDTWAAGGRLRAAYERETGSLPIKDNRRKTCGKGSHCFAIYPPEWRDHARMIVRSIGRTRAAQQGLF